MDKESDKMCATRRTYLAEFDATEVLRTFARRQALINVEKIKPYCSDEQYSTIVEFLETGDEELRSAARSAAAAAASSAVWSAAAAAEYAAESPVWSAAQAAVQAAASSAVWSAAQAARSAASSAANEMLIEMIKDATGWEI